MQAPYSIRLCLPGRSQTSRLPTASTSGLEKDVSTGNVPHILSSGFVYELPFGRGRARSSERLAGRAGRRLAIGRNRSTAIRQSGRSDTGHQSERVRRLWHSAAESDRRSHTCRPTSARRARWFNTAAFTQAPQFTIGNSSRNPVVGPGYRTADVMVGKILHDHRAVENRIPRRGIQRHQYSAARESERQLWKRGVRIDHHGARSACLRVCAEGTLLDDNVNTSCLHDVFALTFCLLRHSHARWTGTSPFR